MWTASSKRPSSDSGRWTCWSTTPGDPHVRLAGRQRAGAVRPDHRDAFGADVRIDAEHLVRGDVLCDADHRADTGVDGLVDRVGGKARGDEDQRRVGAGLFDSFGDGVVDGNALDVLTALSGRDAGDDV